MIDSRLTLSKLHSKFPNLTLDDLFEILDCYTEIITQFDHTGRPLLNEWPYKQTTITYGNSTATTTTNGTEITTSNPVR